MFYTITHTTRFRYTQPITESVMEVRMQPRTEAGQSCLSFELETRPAARVLHYQDFRGNTVHHFNILEAHRRLELVARAIVEMQPQPTPEVALDMDAWAQLDAHYQSGASWEYLHESYFVRFTPQLQAFARQMEAARQQDPLTLLHRLNSFIYTEFEYVQETTTVDSHIDEVLTQRQGVCQDFTHLMVAATRWLRIPARYVSGYLYHRTADHDRSAADATHAWMEAWLPELGWVGFDPTNNLLAGSRHIRCAIGRDYADVSPTKGVFTGNADSQLEVAVQVTTAVHTPKPTAPITTSDWAVAANAETAAQMQQMQQQ